MSGHALDCVSGLCGVFVPAEYVWKNGYVSFAVYANNGFDLPAGKDAKKMDILYRFSDSSCADPSGICVYLLPGDSGYFYP